MSGAIPISYNVRSLAVRKTTTLAAGLSLALVVFVFASALMLSKGLERTIGRSARDDVAIVMRKGADSELASNMSDKAVNAISAAPGVAMGADGHPLIMGEVVVVLLLEQPGSKRLANVQLRGVSDAVLGFRNTARIVEGRTARPGTNEVLIGKALRGRFAGFELGQSFELRKNRPVEVVGIMEDEGSSFESEVWADVRLVAAAFGRQGRISTARVKLEAPSRFDAFAMSLEMNRELEVEAIRESTFYEKQGEGTSLFVKTMGMLLAVIFAVGAMIGASMVMHASVARRQREIATLRALGFSKGSILVSFLFESVVVALGGGLVGVAGALALRFVHFSTTNLVTWTEVAFALEPTPAILGGSLAVAVFMGVVGGFFPAVRASTTNLMEGLRAG
jgi:putative ABC transport system permease protein